MSDFLPGGKLFRRRLARRRNQGRGARSALAWFANQSLRSAYDGSSSWIGLAFFSTRRTIRPPGPVLCLRELMPRWTDVAFWTRTRNVAWKLGDAALRLAR